MPLSNIARRLFRRAVSAPATAPIRNRPIGRQIEQLEDRAVPALVAHYAFDNAGNLGLDSSGLGNDLVSVGTPGFAAAGKLGGALSMDGTANYLTQGAFPTGVPTGGSGYTLAAWVNPTGTPSAHGIIGWGNYGNFNQTNALRMVNDQQVVNYWWSNDLYATAPGSLYAGDPPSGWHHVVATYNPTLGSNQHQIYIDGVLTAQRTIAAPNVQASNFAVGKTVGTEYFNGLLDDVRVYNGAISAAEISILSQGGQTQGSVFGSGVPAFLEQQGPVGVVAGGTAQFNGGGDGNRTYFRTVAGDYFTRNFVAEMDLVSSGSKISFAGLGTGVPNAGNSYTPTAPAISYIFHHPLWGGADIVAWDQGTGGQSFTQFGDNPNTGTHRLRYSWDATTKLGVLEVDFNPTTGTFVADITSAPMNGADNGFTAANGHIYFGGADGVRVDNLLITSAPAAPAGPIAHYTFDSNLQDTSGNNLHGGSLEGGTSYVPGRVGSGALQFTGSQDVDILYSPLLGVNSWTVSAWVNMSAGFGAFANGVLGTRFPNFGAFDIKVQSANVHGDIPNTAHSALINSAVDIDAGNTGSNGQGGTLAPNTWYMLTYVIDGATNQYRLYIDGDLKVTGGTGGASVLMVPGESLRIGNSYSTEYMHGAIDDVYVFGRALTTAEVQALIPAPTGTLTAALSAGTLTVADTAGVVNTISASVSGANLVLTDATEAFQSAPAGGVLSNGNKTLTIPLASVTALNLNLGAGNDTLTANYGGGSFPFPVSYDGGAPGTGPGDKLVVTGGSFATGTHTFTNANSGTVALGTNSLSYAGLEPVDMTGSTIANLVFNLPAAASNAVLENDAFTGNGISQLRSGNGTFETTTFTNPTGSVTINRGNVADTLTVTAVPDLTSTLTIGTLANPFATLTVSGAVALGAGSNFTGFGTTTNVNAAVSVGGAGSVSVTAKQTVVIGGNVTGGTGGVTITGGTAPAVTDTMGVVVNTGVTVTATGTGPVSLTGTGAGTLNAREGVRVLGTVTSGGGNVTLNGTGGSGAANSFNYGVSVSGTVSAGGSGTVQVIGQGGTTVGTGAVNAGVNVQGAGAVITSSGGPVVVQGTGGGNPSSNGGNFGVLIQDSGTITAGGAGTVSVTGVGGAAVGGNAGVLVTNSGQITSGGGSISVSGTGGVGSNTTNYGVWLLTQTTGGIITAPAALTVSGTKGGGATDGIFVTGAGNSTSAGGLATLNGPSASNITIDGAATANFGSLTITAAGATATVFEDSGTALNTATAATVLLDSAGAITDNNGASNNVTATSAVLTAVGGVGTAGDALETAVSNLEGSAGNGFFVANAGPLTIGGIGATNGVSATGGNIVVTAGGNLTAAETVANTGGGTVNLTAGGAAQTIVSNGAWSKSTVSDDGGPSGNWTGPFRATPPAAATFTLPVSLGFSGPGNITSTDEIDIGGGALAVQSNGNTFFYRTTFNLPTTTGITAIFRMSVDNDVQVFLNGQEVAREVNFVVANFTAPNYPAFTINPNGSISSVVQFDNTFNFTNWLAGTNELVLALRNPNSEGINSGGFVFRMDLSSPGDIILNAPVTASGGGAVNLNASGSITEAGAGAVSTAGTLTTSSATGQTLNGANTVGTFNATNSTSGNVAFTNTAATFTITGISETGGTVTVNNTGSTTIAGTGITSTGNVAVTTTSGLTVSNPVASTGGSTTLTFGTAGGTGAAVNAAVTGSPAKVLGGAGADSISVSATGATPLTIDGQGNDDAYVVVFGGLGAGLVAIADTGVSTGDTALLAYPVGSTSDDTFEINTAASGAQAVTSAGQKVTYTGTLEGMDVNARGGNDTFNVLFANTQLPGVFRLIGNAGTDTANVTGTANPDAIDINSHFAQRVTLGSEAVRYDATLEQLTVNGGDEAGLTGDTLTVTPDANTLITVNGGNPAQPTYPGDTLILNTAGLTGAVISPNPALPNGQVASANRQTTNWTGIETFPTPIGMGGAFDFDAVRDTQTQAGWLSTLPTDTLASGLYSSFGIGWVTSPGGFDRDGTNGYFPPTGPLSKLLRDGAWGGQGAGAARDFRVNVSSLAVGSTLQLTAILGDTATINDSVDVLYSFDGVNFTLLNPAADTFQNSLDKGYKFVSYSGEVAVGSGDLTVRIRDNFGNYNWTIDALDVRPLGLRAPLVISGPTLSGAVVADGLTVDNYTGTGAAGGALVTIAPQYGTPVGTDADAAVAGFQVLAAGDGSFAFSVRRPTGDGPSTITASDATGWSKGTATQSFFLPSVRRIDFGPATSPVAAGTPTTQPYIGVGGDPYASRAANALGWVGAVTAVDRGTGSALQRDLVYGTSAATRDFRIHMPAAGTYAVTVIFGDPSFARDGMFVSAVDPTTLAVTPVLTGISTPLGQSVSRTFTATADAGGEIRLRFGDASGDLFWAVQGLEVRPTQGVIAIAGTASVPADGATVTEYTLTGAAANAVVTVSTQFGAVTTADADASFTGVQVVADGSGVAKFKVQSPQSTSNLSSSVSAAEVTGAAAGGLAVAYTGTTGGSGKGYRFDFNGAAGDTTANFVGVRGNQTFTAGTGYGWSKAVSEFERTTASVTAKGVTASQAPLYRDGAAGSGSGTFRVSVSAGETNLAARIYVGDSYKNWPYLVLNVEGNTGSAVALNTAATPFGAYVLTGKDANNDGVWDVTVSSSTNGTWVVNGIDVASGGTGNLPALPEKAAASPATLAGSTLAAAELAPVVAAAIDRLAAAGTLSAAQVAQLQAVRFEVGDLGDGHLGEHLGGLVRLDADAVGRGWFVDATPMDDAEFAPTSATAGVGGRGVDLLTVVMHELSHELGAIDLSAEVEPDALMTEELGAGVRRLPSGGAWALSVGVNRIAPHLWLDEAKEVAGDVAAERPAVAFREESAWADVPAVSAGAAGTGRARSATPVLSPDWFGDDLLGVEVG